MDKWDEAAMQLSDEIGDESGATDKQRRHIKKLIDSHHADLRRTYSKMAELLQRLKAEEEKFYNPLVAIANKNRIKELKADPDIQAAIQKGEEG